MQYLRPGLQKGEKERLQINGRLFEYQDLIFIPAFHTTEYGGGPIYADSKLRLTVAGDYIVKVEVQQHACPAAPDFPRPETS